MGILELGSPLRFWSYCFQKFAMIQNWHPIQWLCVVCYPSARSFTPGHSPFFKNLEIWILQQFDEFFNILQQPKIDTQF